MPDSLKSGLEPHARAAWILLVIVDLNRGQLPDVNEAVNRSYLADSFLAAFCKSGAL